MEKNLPLWGYLVLVVVTFAVGYGMWSIGKHLNYAWMYEDMVRETVMEMVKQEALR